MLQNPKFQNHLSLSTTRCAAPTNRSNNRRGTAVRFLSFQWVYLPPTQGLPRVLGALLILSVVSLQFSLSARLCGRADGRCPRPAASARRNPTGRQQVMTATLNFGPCSATPLVWLLPFPLGGLGIAFAGIEPPTQPLGAEALAEVAAEAAAAAPVHAAPGLGGDGLLRLLQTGE